MKTGVWIGAACLLVAGCTAPVPDSGAGVGFGDYAEFELERARREAELTGQPLGGPLSAQGPQTSLGPNPNTDVIPGAEGQTVTTNDLAAAGIGVGPDAGTAPINSGGLGNATTVDPDPTALASRNVGDNPELSDEQNFDAVTSRETIESDASRLADSASRLVVVEPVPLPTERTDSGPNIVQYAISAPNQKGQQWWSRTLLSGDSRFQRNCATYANPDAAQRDFLIRGGPERDPRGIDPDGDGFACGWDPAPFKLAAGN
ncbi:MAG: hypothetical protein AAFP98_06340 [Pseudomonadota bacterium]